MPYQNSEILPIHPGQCVVLLTSFTGMQSLIKEVLTTPSDLEFVLHLSHEWI